jgi:hypothetical protein
MFLLIDILSYCNFADIYQVQLLRNQQIDDNIPLILQKIITNKFPHYKHNINFRKKEQFKIFLSNYRINPKLLSIDYFKYHLIYAILHSVTYDSQIEIYNYMELFISNNNYAMIDYIIKTRMSNNLKYIYPSDNIIKEIIRKNNHKMFDYILTMNHKFDITSNILLNKVNILQIAAKFTSPEFFSKLYNLYNFTLQDDLLIYYIAKTYKKDKITHIFEQKYGLYIKNLSVPICFNYDIDLD